LVHGYVADRFKEVQHFLAHAKSLFAVIKVKWRKVILVLDIGVVDLNEVVLFDRLDELSV
jgi:hypothetical protein